MQRVRAEPLPVAGQWIWSPADASLFVEARVVVPMMTAGVWLSTLTADGDRVRQRLALPVAVAPTGARLAVVVRFDDGLHLLWDRLDDAAWADAVAAPLTRLLAQIERTGAVVAEVQLDYDCPVRRLPRWAAVVRRLGHGALAGRTVWITSLAAHVHESAYGDWFRDAVAGHIVQVFDAGVFPTPAAATALERSLAAARMPFRVGVGAFERDGGSTAVSDHRGWFGAARVLATAPGFAGLWVFPAGCAWLPAWRASG